MSQNRARTMRRAQERAETKVVLKELKNPEESSVRTDDKPEPLGKGVYSIYELPDGSGLLAYRPDHMTTDQHQVIPAGLWSMFMSLMRGERPNVNPMDIIKAMMPK